MTNSKRTKPQVKEIRPLGKLGMFRVQALDLTFANGQEREYFRLAAKRDAVTVVAVDGNDLLLIEEFAGGTLEYELGFVRGAIDEGETYLQAGGRELAEEAGYEASSLTHLTTMYNSTGYQTAKMYVVVATGLSALAQRPEGDEPEPLEIVRWPLTKLDELLTHPRFRDSRNLVALYAFRDYYHQYMQS
ncbi:ADP compounds hydrolase NudE [Psittacicella hinzii]|uniref:ADP compounds hydrolase NudE n=1 Tax=Psittacicella hinzii TaxID=2028575 RepID=A0A3A1YNP5_9GAMM|nr:ADP compounds hydrolase NudE [Psittacicella hinzii]RIY39305.1 ADP compounds hydrolase NudE [Psittacicella hinzii]